MALPSIPLPSAAARLANAALPLAEIAFTEVEIVLKLPPLAQSSAPA